MPCDYTLYPLDWLSRIRPEIMARAGHRCERCGIANYTVVRRPAEVRLRVFPTYAAARKRRGTLQAKADFIAPRLNLFPLKRADVMPSMRDHHRIAPLIDPAS